MRKITSAAEETREIIFGEEFSAREFIVFTVYSFNTVWVFARPEGENETTPHTNLSSFHKSKLWIYQFFNFFLLSLKTMLKRWFLLLILFFIPAQSQCLKRWNLFWNWGWQAFNVWRKLAENEWKSKSSKNLIFLMIFKSSRN